MLLHYINYEIENRVGQGSVLIKIRKSEINAFFFEAHATCLESALSVSSNIDELCEALTCIMSTNGFYSVIIFVVVRDFRLHIKTNLLAFDLQLFSIISKKWNDSHEERLKNSESQILITFIVYEDDF